MHRFRPPIELKLFGAFSLRVDGAEVSGVPEPAQELLARLATAGARGLDRAELAAALWPQAAPERARFYLRRCLSQLRALLGPHRERLRSPGDHRVALDLDGCACDTTQYEALERRRDEASMAAAAEAVTGDLLAGHRSEWARQTRDVYRERLIELLWSLAEMAEQRGDLGDAAARLNRARAADPLREETCRRLMRVLGLRGDFAGTVRLFRDLKAALRHDLGLNPGSETVELYRRLLAGAGAARIPRAEATGPRTAHLSPPPSSTTPFIGRKAELEELRSAILACRLVTITGPGGIGKTRIAEECARSSADLFPGGVAFADMSACIGGEEVAEHLAAALGTSDDVAFENISRSAVGPVLLVVDGAEHVAGDCATAVERLLRAVPDIHVLCTSRVAPRTPDQRIMALGPMELPPASNELDDDVVCFDAVALFLACAARAAPAFRPGPGNRRQIVELCRGLDGMPLALSLAAVRLRTLPIDDILANLDDRFSLLDVVDGSVDRRKTLEGVLAWSYRLLSAPERTLFIRLGVFPHSWNVDAAQAVCADSELDSSRIPGLLGNLVDHSLVTFDPQAGGGRYRLLETVASYARRLLYDESQAPVGLMFRHAQYCVLCAEDLDVDRLDLADFEADEPNYLAAIDALVKDPSEERRPEALRLVNRLLPVWERAGAPAKGLRVARRVIEAAGDLQSELLVECLYRAGEAAHTLYQIDVANALFARAQAMADALGLDSWATESLRGRGEVAADEGRLNEADQLLNAALARYRAGDDPSGEAVCLATLGYVKRQRGELRGARELTEAAMAGYTAQGNIRGRLWCLGSLGANYLAEQNPGAAVPLFLSALEQWENADNVDGQTWNLTMLGVAERELGNFAAAEAYIRRALSTLGDDPEDLRTAWQMTELGELERRAGRPAPAESTLNTALRLSREGGSVTLEVRSLIRLCAVAIDKGDLDSARAYHSAAAKVVADAGAPQLAGEIAEVAARLASVGRGGAQI